MNASFLWSEWPETEVCPDNIKWGAIRSYRQRLLSESDWTQLPDTPFTLEERQAWANYRQALRDLPEDFGDPDNVDFPEQPA